MQIDAAAAPGCSTLTLARNLPTWSRTRPASPTGTIASRLPTRYVPGFRNGESATPSSALIVRPCRLALVHTAMPPVTRRLSGVREIWVDDALCRAARCRRVALRQRRVAAFVIVGPPGVHVQANRISRIVGLGRRRLH